MQCLVLLAFMLAYLAEINNQLCLLQQASRRMLGTAKMLVQLSPHPWGMQSLWQSSQGGSTQWAEGEAGTKNILISETFFRPSPLIVEELFGSHLMSLFSSDHVPSGPSLQVCVGLHPQEVRAIPWGQEALHFFFFLFFFSTLQVILVGFKVYLKLLFKVRI